MNKADAVSIFGSVANLAAALGVTRQAIYKLPESLHQRDADRIVGAAIRLGLSIPADFGIRSPVKAAA
jgi:UTP--glucose-1-phosphate uridylyltransferase